MKDCDSCIHKEMCWGALFDSQNVREVKKYFGELCIMKGMVLFSGKTQETSKDT